MSEVIITSTRLGNVVELEAAIKKLPSGSKLENIKDVHGRNPLLIAAQEGHADVLKILICDKHFPDINAHKDTQGNTALGLAISANHLRAVQQLLDSGANPSIPSGSQGSVVYTACSSRQSTILKSLLHAGADPNATSKDGMPVLFISAAMAGVKLKSPGRESEAAGAIECVELLLDHGADPDVSAAGGFTPLHVAAESGSHRMMKALLDAGADSTLKTGGGQTPAAVAATWGHRDIAQVLLKHTTKSGHNNNDEGNKSVDELIAEAEAQAAERRKLYNEQINQQSDGTQSDINIIPEPEEPDEDKAAELRKQGNEAFVGADFEKALHIYHNALRHSTKCSELWSNAAAAALRLGRNDEALRDARIGRTLDVKNVKAWYREGQAAEGLGMWEDAAAAYFEAYLVKPEGVGGLDFGALVKAVAEKGRAANAALAAAAGAMK